MSQSPSPSFSQPIEHETGAKSENPAGLSGFIVSLIGLFLCGIPSIIGVIISAIGLRKEPRGFAIAGLIIGLIGLLEAAAGGYMAYQGFQAIDSLGITFREVLATTQLNVAAIEVGHEWERLARIPTQEEGQQIVNGKRDMTGNSILYETDGSSFSLRSAGEDGVLDTDDDVTVGPFSDMQSVKDLEDEFEIEPSDADLVPPIQATKQDSGN